MAGHAMCHATGISGLLDSERHVSQALARVGLATIGANVQTHRLNMGLSIRNLAKRAMVSKSTIVALEQGRSCRPATLAKVCAAMGLHVERFLDPTAGGQAKELVHRRGGEEWFALDSLTSGPASESEGARLVMFQNIPADAGFRAGLIELRDVTPVREHLGREFVYVLKGSALIEIDGRSFTLVAGESAFVPEGAPHAYGPAQGSADPVQLLCVRVD